MLRIEATHFIEVYKGISYNRTRNTTCMKIKYLKEALEDTKSCNWIETVAIWKIKFKK
jgi:hypothetical protein